MSESTNNTRSIITIEKEFFNDKNGIPMVNRVVKEDGIIICEDTIEVSFMDINPTKLDIFERWIKYLKNPDIEFVGYSSWDKDDNEPIDFLAEDFE